MVWPLYVYIDSVNGSRLCGCTAVQCCTISDLPRADSVCLREDEGGRKRQAAPAAPAASLLALVRRVALACSYWPYFVYSVVFSGRNLFPDYGASRAPMCFMDGSVRCTPVLSTEAAPPTPPDKMVGRRGSGVAIGYIYRGHHDWGHVCCVSLALAGEATIGTDNKSPWTVPPTRSVGSVSKFLRL